MDTLYLHSKLYGVTKHYYTLQPLPLSKSGMQSGLEGFYR